MMMKKKLLSSLLIASALIAVGCSTESGSSNAGNDNQSTAEQTEETTTTESSEKGDDSEEKDSSADEEATTEEGSSSSSDELTGEEAEKEASSTASSTLLPSEVNLDHSNLGDSEALEVSDEVSGTFTATFDLSHHDADDSVRLWIPHAQSDDYQEISNVKIEVGGEDVDYEINTDENGNEMIYVEWTGDQTDRQLTYSFDVTRQEREIPEFGSEEEINPAEFEAYLGGSNLVPVNGAMKEISDEIAAAGDSVQDKVIAIYDWIYLNMERNEDVEGCGTGNALDSVASLDGKCTDIHSVFIALARAQGIPAREIFGVRLAEEDADQTKSQHCWAEYYQPGTGWVAIDIADVLKGILTDDLDKESPEAKDLYDYYYGNLDAKRVGFSTGRDLNLNPQQDDGPVNQFGYPYAEVDGEALDFYDPEGFGYSIQFEYAGSSDEEADDTEEAEDEASTDSSESADDSTDETGEKESKDSSDDKAASDSTEDAADDKEETEADAPKENEGDEQADDPDTSA